MRSQYCRNSQSNNRTLTFQQYLLYYAPEHNPQQKLFDPYLTGAFDLSYLLSQTERTVGRSQHTLDRIDREIIRLLNEDGRMSNAEIARRLGGVPSRSISHRVERLIARDIINVRAIVNPLALGYHVMADVLVEVEPGCVRKVAETVARFPQVSYVACATGDTDVSISLRVRSNEELFDFVTDQLSRIPGVRRTQTHLLPAKLKDIDTWLPPNVLDASEGEDSEGP